MSLQIVKVLRDLEVNDYFLGTDGETIWKVLKKREDGYVGITNKAGDKVIVKPENTGTVVQQIIFEFDTLEEMHAAAEKKIADELGGKVIARKIEPGDWQMPSLFEMYDDAIQLKAHLAVHHGAIMCGPEATLGDLKEVHTFAHTLSEDAPDHTHANE